MRFISPATLLFALLMFPLPWVEVRCEAVPRTPFSSLVLVDQSGLQSIWGGYNENRLAYNAANPPRNQPFPGANPPNAQKNRESFKDELKIKPAPLMAVYLALLLAGIGLGFALPRSKVRVLLLGGCCLGATAILFVQIALGFPLVKQAKEPNIVALLEGLAAEGWPDPRAPRFAFTTGYNVCFFLAVVATFGSLVGVLIEVANPPRPRRREIEDEDEDYDPRPRRRRDREKDDYDDPRPPRRRYEDEEDEDEDDRGPPRRPGGYYR